MGEVYDDRFWSLGEKTKAAEAMCSRKVFGGLKKALLTNDGTHAIELCLRDINVQDKFVIVPAMTVPMVGWAVEQAGGIPLPADIDEGLQLDLESVMDLYADHGSDIAAIVLVHTGGLITPDIYEFVSFCRERGIQLVEDISHAQCSYIEVKGRQHFAGTFGDYAAFSMYATKVISAGEGGFAAKAGSTDGMEALRNQGKNKNQTFVRKGYNFRASEWTAAVALTKLAFLERELAHRRKMAALYDAAGVRGLHNSRLLYGDWKMVPSFYKYIIRAPKELEQDLSHYTGAVHRDGTYEHFPNASNYSRNHVCLDLRSEDAVRTTVHELEAIGGYVE